MVKNGRRGVAKYWNGLHVEWKRTVGRSGVVIRANWSVSLLIADLVFYTVLFIYEGIEIVCQWWFGVGVVLVAVNYCYLCEEGVLKGEVLILNHQVVLLSIGTVMTGVLSKIWSLFEKDGRSPKEIVSDGFAEWCSQMKEMGQVENLSQEFWRLDDAVPTSKKKIVRTRNAAQAEKRALQSKMREAGRASEAR
ncbi:hypothetical protein PC129_g19584 [Phytophthora cactorum]|uniref:Uncharacterized protein n=1 Tax=Phytophthora cactorum TaxID=29920 RepID=A0A329S6E7_9STRA|nr:hypothetical protein Pcac1_g13172 [Phytophthora cactorum]KAG2801027.1 hypothetical protein PC112_g20221 [Phytophthora cactorum]KAG2815554.1 hypothetical protein PC111_g13518 [Phytophthora cactorum]KAG2850779.1 hypothetical protein PC113_g16483 [Phytophthora cactorum]KAG2879077.1 hypothetical protein PC114_g22760 [Phytophthora cactorum]